MRNLALCLVVVALSPTLSAAGNSALDHTYQALHEAMDTLAHKEPAGMSDPVAAATMLGTPESIFDFVRDQIAFVRYGGRLCGPRGTLESAAGNDVDQSELLGIMLASIGAEYRYAKARRTSVPGGPQEHVWVQIKEGDAWRDLDPTAAGFQDGGRVGSVRTMAEIPRDLSHRVHLDVGYRIVRSGKKEVLSALAAEFDVAYLYGVPLTLANRFDGSRADGEYVVRAVQPVLMAADSAIYGSIISTDPRPEARHPSRRLVGVFDRLDSQPPPARSEALAGLEVLSQWIDVRISSPGRSPDRFRHVVFDTEADYDAAGEPFEALLAVQAMGFSPAVVTDQALMRHLRGTSVDVRELLEGVTRISRLSMTPEGPEEEPVADDAARINLALESGQRALASTVLAYYLFNSDEALSTVTHTTDITPYHGAPRAIIASVRLHNGTTRYELDLRRNRVLFAAPQETDPDLLKFIAYHRGIYESRLEGAVLQAFSGQPGLTAADVLHAAQDQEISLIVLSRANRGDMRGVRLSPASRSHIGAALTRGHTVLVPERPPILDARERLAWWEYDPDTGFIQGVFPSGAHQGMTEYVVEEVVLKTLVSQGMSYLTSSIVGYYVSIAFGLGHFYGCLFDLDVVDKVCFGQPEVCLPAFVDARRLCKAWENAKGNYDKLSSVLGRDLLGLIPWPNAWEAIAGDACERGVLAGLRWFGCRP